MQKKKRTLTKCKTKPKCDCEQRLDAFNLDNIVEDDLLDIVRANAAEQYPAEYKLYAALQLAAKAHRLAGNVGFAQEIESVGDRVFRFIPKDWRW